MSCQILEGNNGKAVFYCSTAEWAFGPVMQNYGKAKRFLEWCKQLGIRPRMITENELEKKYYDFRREQLNAKNIRDENTTG